MQCLKSVLTKLRIPLSIQWVILLVICWHSEVSAQKEVNNWYFGNRAGITFNPSTVTALTNGQLNTSEGCATISNFKGQLLFYTDGISVWDSTHSITPNGTGLKGNSSSTQSGIIVPNPGNSKQFYIFTVDDVAGSDGLQYSLFDLSLNSGLGDIVSTVKNVKIADYTCEKITAVQHANGKDFWVCTHKFTSDTIYSFLVNSSGVVAKPVASSTKFQISGSAGNTLGYMKISPDGTKIAFANWTYDTTGLGDFDTKTGRVTNVWSFYNDDAYGIEFSANSKFLYVAEMYKYNIYQYDLKAPNKGLFLLSKTLVDYRSGAGTIGALQIGPDKKIYICRTSRASLDVIHAPDSAGSACRVRYDVVSLSGRPCIYGLPTFIQSYFNPDFNFSGTCFGDTAWFSISDSTIADSVHWSFGDTASKAKNFAKGFRVWHLFSKQGNYKVRSISFRANLRDTAYLNVEQPIYLGRVSNLDPIMYKCYDDTLRIDLVKNNEKRIKWSNGSDSAFTRVVDSGYYSVKRYYGSQCYTIDSVKVRFYKGNVLPGSISLGKDIYKCPYDSVKLSYYDINAKKYIWNTGVSNLPIQAYKPGLYSIKAFYGGSCYRTDTVAVLNYGISYFTLGKDTFFCPKQNILMGYFNMGFNNYLWSTGSTSPFLTPDTTGTYWLKVKDANGCFAQDTIKATALAIPKVNLGSDTSVCNATNGLILNAKNVSTFNKYKWGNNNTKQFDTVKTNGKYWVTVSNACGKSTDTIKVSFLVKPKAPVFRDSLFCNTLSKQLDAGNSGIGATYLWNTKDTSRRLTISTPGVYKVKISNKCGTDSAKMTATLLFKPSIAHLRDTIFCNNFNLKLKVGKSNNSETYDWNDIKRQVGLGQIDSVILNNPGLIEITVKNQCGTAHDTLLVEQYAKPKITLDSLYTFCKTIVFNPNIQSIGKAEAYKWNTGSTQPGITINNPGKYWAKAQNYCGMDSVNFRVELLQPPTVNLGNDTVYCGALNRTLDATFNDPTVSYQWKSGQTTPIIVATTPGVYGVKLSNYCGIAIDSIALVLYQTPKPNLGNDTVFCDGVTSITKSVSISNPTETYLWSTGNTGRTETFTSPGLYWVKVSTPCGDYTDSLKIGLSSTPVVNLGKDTSLCGDFKLVLDATQPGMRYLWHPNGETTPSIVATKQIIYSVDVTNSAGCTGKGDIQINGNCISKFWFPNSFTPNGDQLNESFKPVLVNFEKYEMRVFNRWGELLFLTTDADKGWDGTYQGAACQSGVYFYTASFMATENNTRQFFKGEIHLVR
jgi:gliding motility-associated-like protein